MAIILKNVPKTEEGRKLNLSKEDDEKYRLVFRINKESKELEICDIWNPEASYGNDCLIVPVTSTYKSVETMLAGTEVRNVIDSTDDPFAMKGYNWIELIEYAYEQNKITENARVCCLNKYAYSQNGDKKEVTNHGKTMILGGHMVKGKDENNQIKKGDSFYLLHICKSHNHRQYNDCYFTVETDTCALVMEGFMLPPQMTDTLVGLSESTKTNEDVEFDVKQFCEENNVELQGMGFE